MSRCIINVRFQKKTNKKKTCMYMYNVPYHSVNTFNSLPASPTDANSLDPEQTLQSVVPDLDPNCFTISKFSGKQTANHEIFRACKELMTNVV